jgi:hypothetical protein
MKTAARCFDARLPLAALARLGGAVAKSLPRAKQTSVRRLVSRPPPDASAEAQHRISRRLLVSLRVNLCHLKCPVAQHRLRRIETALSSEQRCRVVP